MKEPAHASHTFIGPDAVDFIAGAAAGAVSIATTQPLDMVRIRMQTCVSSPAAATAAAVVSGASSGGGTAAMLNRSTTTPFQMLLCMIRKEGALSPYKGMSFPLLSTTFQSAVIFQVYGSTLRFLDRSFGSTSTNSLPPSSNGESRSLGRTEGSGRKPEPSMLHTFLAGAAAGTVQV